MIYTDRLRELRKQNKLSQSEVAEKLGITASAYGFYEQGKTIPNAEALSILADLFNVSTDYLLGRAIFPNSENEDSEIKILARKARSLTPEQLKAVQAVIDSYERNKKHNEMD